jgi:WD40 repeat protein
MRFHPLLLAGLATLLVGLASSGRDDKLAPDPPQLGPEAVVKAEPILQIESNGPRGQVQGLAFSPDGATLYVGGYDKVVRVWKLGAKGFVLDDKLTYRVPIGPGLGGAIASLAVSPNSKYLAVAGNGLISGTAGYHQEGAILPGPSRMSNKMLEDQGAIYVFDTAKGQFVRALRGHKGIVLNLAFAPSGEGNQPLTLVSAARESEKGKYVGRLRTWDVNTGEQQAVSEAELPDPINDEVGAAAPGLAAFWTSGKKLVVGLGWNDRKARLWDVEGNRFTSADDGKVNGTAAFLSDGTLLTGSHNPDTNRACLTPWNAAVNGLIPDKKIDLEKKSAPSSLALLNNKRGEVDRAAVILRFPLDDSSKEDFRLQMINLVPGANYGTILSDRHLWNAGRLRQLVAASPDGRFLATAGNDNHEIHLFNVADLEAKPQILASSGMTFQKAIFVNKGEKGESLGLQLEDAAKGKHILNLTTRQLTEDLTDWKRDGPNLEGWKVVPLKPDTLGRRGYEVRKGDTVFGSIRLGVNQTATAGAPLPPSPTIGLKGPLLAVAVEERGATYLNLYDVESGDQVRQFTWHISPIRSLSFSADGRLLMSASDDQTVAVWTLTDLDHTLGKRGLLRGFRVQGANQKQLTLGALDQSELSPVNRKALKDVRENQEISSVLKDGKEINAATPKDFHQAVWRCKPGTELTLHIGNQDVVLTVDQGIDERKPLFALFVKGGDKLSDRHWIGWSPIGPYDTTDPQKTEDMLVWHLNTGKASEPTKAAPAKEYRQEFYKRNLLLLLVKHAELNKALDGRIAPRPEMKLTFKDADARAPKDKQDRIVLQNAPGELRASVVGPDHYPLGSVFWTWDGGPERPFRDIFQTSYTAPLSDKDWTRGVHTIRLTVKTTDSEDTVFNEELRVRFAPRPPEITMMKQPDGSVPDKIFHLKGQVKPGEGAVNQKLTVQLLQDDKKAVDLKLDEKNNFDQEVALQPGVNLLKMEAFNTDADADSLPFEKAEPKVVRVVFEARSPVVTLEDVQSGEKTVGVPGKNEVLVSTRKVVIQGRVTCDDDIVDLSLTQGVNISKVAIKKGDQKSSAYTFSQEVTLPLLPPQMTQTLEFTASTENKKTGKSKLVIAYQPVLPTFALIQPDSKKRGAEEPLELKLEGKLGAQEPDAPLPSVKVTVNGGAPIAAKVDRATRQVGADITLRPGKNDLRVVLDNGYRQGDPIPVFIYHQQPPVVVELAEPKVGKIPKVEIRAEVETAADLEVTGGRVERHWKVKDQDMPPLVTFLDKEHLKLIKEGKEKNTWAIKVPDVPLVEGANRIVVFARNRDGDSKPRQIDVTVEKPVLPGPKVTLVEPANNQDFADPTCPLVFRVRSSSPLRGVSVRVEGKEVLTLDKLDGKKKDGEIEFTAPKGLELAPGVNKIQVLAFNEGGEGSEPPVRVSYIRAPVRFILEDLQDPQNPNQIIKPDRLEGGQPIFEKSLPSGRWLVRGRVEWGNAVDPLLNERVMIRTAVNDFEQFDAALEDAVGLERKFTALIRLNQQKDNKVVLRFDGPKLPRTPEFKVNCERPEPRQRLHLLLVSPGHTDQDKLRQSVLDAFQAKNKEEKHFQDKDGDRFHTGAFVEGRIIALPTYVTRNEFTARLEDLNQEIRDLSRKKKDVNDVNDVIVVYFRGKEAIEPNAHYLLTEDAEKRGDWHKKAINCDTLRQQLADFVGAKLIVLDVNREGDQPIQPGRIADWQATPGVGVLRYVSLAERKTPEQERLITALEDSLTRAALLGKVRQDINGHAQKYSKNGLFFNWYTPEGLDKLRLGDGGGE